MNHAECERLLAVYRDLAGTERAEVDRHLAECPACVARFEAYRRMDHDLRRLPDPAPSPRLRTEARAALARADVNSGWQRLADRARVAAQAGLVVVLSLAGLLLAYVWTRPGFAPASGTGPVATPTLSTPGPGVADILANPPAPGETVELDAYYSGAMSFPFSGGPRPADDEVVCPFNWAQALTDRPFAATLALLNGYRGNSLPADGPWLVAVTPDAAEPGRRTMPQLPYHARLRGHLGEPALAHCRSAERIFVVEEVVHVYQQEGPQATLSLPEDYASWARHHDPALGYSLPHPPDWRVERQSAMTVLLRGPQWPGYPVTVRVHAGETLYDQYDPGSTPPLLQGPSWGVYEQGWAFGEGAIAGSQHLAGWVVDRSYAEAEGSPATRTTAALFSAHGHTYELELCYPLGFDALPELLAAYTAMVEGLRFDTLPAPSPTPPVRQELGPGPFLSQEEALARVRARDGQGIELLQARLVAEAEARRGQGACSIFVGHPAGVWLLTVRGSYDGQVRTILLYLDATTGEQLCGEELAPDGVAPTPGPAPTAAVAFLCPPASSAGEWECREHTDGGGTVRARSCAPAPLAEAEWLCYENLDYGFALEYPASLKPWTRFSRGKPKDPAGQVAAYDFLGAWSGMGLEIWLTSEPDLTAWFAKQDSLLTSPRSPVTEPNATVGGQPAVAFIEGGRQSRATLTVFFGHGAHVYRLWSWLPCEEGGLPTVRRVLDSVRFSAEPVAAEIPEDVWQQALDICERLP